MNDEIIAEIKGLSIECTVCAPYREDDQYQCELCGCGGGHGRIMVLKYITDHPEKFGLRLLDTASQ